MQSRMRLLGAIRGEEIDRVPWSPFLAYYWESLPADVRAGGQYRYLREMGADPLLRGFQSLTKCTFTHCDIRESRIGRELYRTYDTPVGALTEKYVYSERGDTTFLVTHPVETADQFRTLQYLHEHMTIERDTAAFDAERARCGDGALILPTIGVAAKTAFQSMVEHWVGTENLAYALYDEPEAVEECLQGDVGERRRDGQDLCRYARGRVHLLGGLLHDEHKPRVLSKVHHAGDQPLGPAHPRCGQAARPSRVRAPARFDPSDGDH